MRKAFKAQDLTSEGKVAAIIATLEVKDKDGDVTLPGFFGQQPTRMVWSHQWDRWVGKGRVYEDGGAAVFDGEFFMDTQAGEEAYRLVKGMGDLAEWSYGFDILPGGSREADWKGERVRLLQPKDDGTPGVKVHEVSPVLVGAGEGTRTLALKDGQVPTLAEQVSSALASVEAVAQSVTALDAKLREGGHTLSEAKAAVLAELEDGLQKALATVSPVLHTPTDDPAVAMRAAHAHLEHLLAGL